MSAISSCLSYVLCCSRWCRREKGVCEENTNCLNREGSDLKVVDFFAHLRQKYNDREGVQVTYKNNETVVAIGNAVRLVINSETACQFPDLKTVVRKIENLYSVSI